MRKYEITYSNSAKINTGNYEQLSPMFCIKSMIETEDQFSEIDEFNRLKGLIDPLVTDYIKTQKKDLSKIRIRMKDGKQYPSVTSILNPISIQRDEDYSIRGIEIHSIWNDFIKTQQWRKPQIPLKKITYEEIKYEQFWNLFKDKINLKEAKTNIECYNDDYSYSGEIDLICPINDVLTLVDIKTGSWSWNQLVAYLKAINDPLIRQLAVFDLKKCNLEILDLKDNKAKRAWESFLISRGIFQNMYDL